LSKWFASKALPARRKTVRHAAHHQQDAKNLEDELNCTLLIRDGRRLLLTDTGRVVFERGQAILGEFHQLESELSDINHLHKGVLRLGIPPMVGMLMAEPISRFRQRYAGVELKIAEFGGLTVQQAVSNGDWI
jgi:DNA-binding transcriptional LysR family regulator